MCKFSLRCVRLFLSACVVASCTVPAFATELVCTREEHVHTDSCYIVQQELQCNEALGIFEENIFEDTFFLPLGEIFDSHVHDESCWVEEQVLVCNLEEHTHTSECFTEEQQDSYPPIRKLIYQ